MHYNSLSCRTIKNIIVAGEQLVLNKKIIECLKNFSFKIHNHYGPTETHVVTTYTISEDKNTILVPPIGKPISNTRVYILDNNLNIVPIGVIGNIYIAGEGVARGYLNKEKLTNKKFIINPFNDNERMYDTGDIGYWNSDGEIIFHGRNDCQIKIRGFRVEKEEIEIVFKQFEKIKDCIVTAIKNEIGDVLLVAYYLTSDEINEVLLRDFLKTRLPEYMIPTYMIQMESFPLTTNGKINLKAFPKPTINNIEYTSPQNDIEKKLAEIWSEILDIDLSRVGINNDFFELGGHSLKAIRLIHQIHQVFEKKIELRDIFRHTTIKQQAQLLNEKGIEQYLLIPKVEEKAYYDLSGSQKRLWVLSKLEKASQAYNMPFPSKLIGKIDLEIFKQSLEYLINRHESLRTIFIEINGVPKQKILALLEIPQFFHIIDLTENPHSQQIAENILTETSQIEFDLTTGPLFKIELIKISENEHILLLNLHHIISDGWSMNIILRDLLVAYNAYEKGKNPPLSPLSIQYKDYAAWNNQQIDKNNIDAQYWKKQFKGEIPILNLPTDHPRPKIQTYNGSLLSFHLDYILTEKINNLCKIYNVTLFTALMSFIKILLYKYTGQTDIVIGFPVAGREHAGLEDQVGCYLNTLALRTIFEENISFERLLSKVKENVMNAYEHRAYPFDRLVEELSIKRDLSRNPLFDVLLVLQNTDIHKHKIPQIDNLKIFPYETIHKVSKFDITFIITEQCDTIRCDIEYNTDLYDQKRLERMIEHLKILVESVVSNPTINISELEILTPDEKYKLFTKWNNTNFDYPKDKCIHQLFEEQVEKNPENIAVIYGEESLTYKELNKKSNQLAHYLREKGVKPDSFVGICIERSLEMIVGLFGILKAGGCYVPIDPSYPKERISYILNDSNCQILLSKKYLEPLLNNSRVIYLDTDWEEIENRSTENVKSDVTSNNLVYTIYTSGSTGKPKGTLIEHKALMNRIDWMQRSFPINENDTILQKTTFTFDVSVWELFWWSMYGAKVALLKPGEEKEPESIINAIEFYKITTIHFVPSMYNVFLNHVNTIKSYYKIKSLKQIFSSGEALTGIHVANSETILKENNTTLINLYGPTEATIDVSYYICNISDRLIPIGKPISNTQFYVVDKQCKPVPLGVPGELCIAGEGLARGYLNRPQLTAEKFIKNPFCDKANSRLYKTGDLVKYLPDGNIEFLGRIDNQVKIRGFRVELGEIELAISKLKTIKDCIVITKDDTYGLKRLIAYIIPQNDFNVKETREELSKILPDYMIPSLFVTLDQFPLTPNGKIDRKALPEAEFNVEKTHKYVAPETTIEQKLANIWQEVLGIEKIGVFDNFFELGGHSLLAIQIISKIKSTLNKEIPLKTLFETPTIKQLSHKIQNSESVITILPKVQSDPINRYEPFPLTDVQQAYWIGRRDLYTLGNVGTHSYSEIYLEELDVERLNSAINYLIERHDMLRMVITEDGKQKILEKVEPYQVSILNLMDKSKRNKKDDFYKLRDKLSHQIFDGYTWPLFEIWVTKFQDGTYKIHFSMDALLFDALSGRIFLNELLQIYQSQIKKLPPLNVTFRDYVIAEQSIRETDLYKNSRDYWVKRLENFPGKPELPLAISPQDIKNPRFNRKILYLNSKKWNSLQNNIKKAGVTSTVFFIECFGHIIDKWSKNNHFLLNLTLFNRLPLHKDVDKIIGDFTSLTILEMDYRKNKTFINRLKDTQRQLWEDLEHKYFSGVQVQRELSRIKGETISLPVVITSVLGLDDNDNIEIENEQLSFSQLQKEQEFNEIKQAYSITQTSQVWLDYKILKHNGGIRIEWDFVEKLFPADMLDAMFATFASLLNDLAINKELWEKKNIVNLPDEQIKIQEEANSTSSPISTKLMHELFVEQVRKNKKQIAIKTKRKVLNYGQLYDISNNIGNNLRQLGAKTNTLIAIIMHKGWEQIAAALGIQFSGAAYLPIDASLPHNRILQLLEISKAELVVSISSVLNNLSLPTTIKTLNLDNLKYSGNANLEKIYYQKCTDLAYVIFTSGSTGEPKGVMIDHKGAVNTILDINNKFNITKTDSCFAISSLSFDLSVYDIFGLLAAGGTIIIPEPSEQKDPAAWTHYIINENITIWNSVPALMQMLVEYIKDTNIIFPFRTVLLSGDWIPVSLPNKIKKICPNAKVISLGGATEASIWSIYYPINQIHSDWKSIPYGKPLSNQSFYVLKPDLTPCPQWVPGDLYIGGKGLALGYWQDEAKTTSSFIIHPETKERLYKTGDMGRYLPDGNIEFLGREDAQVKIQGYRIELGEIEHALEEHDQIRKAIVDVKDIGNTKKLVAYIIPNQNEENINNTASHHKYISYEEELNKYLSNKLPNYMVPSYYFKIEKIPLTTNGKVNRKVLPVPQIEDSKNHTHYGTPSNEIEEKLVNILHNILGNVRISVDVNFFELGLDSIQIVSLHNIIKKEMNVELEIVDLFVFTTIKKLSNHIKGKKKTESDNRNSEIVASKKNYNKLLQRKK
ncbi:non-ribosomal peptide synthetase [Parabacteroides merdae]|uniref:Amino acid adenylation domain-containing protein n=1 Tax=Parabacteroides merdae TaxID=46503 RepID=A0A3R6FKW5_9BACT|nr:non-ribosomal peptide synthetase [Parabacteroides merdae]RHC79098.1 amino acid adenylation domain-containing protein [Parabacteroides merdae]